MLLPMKWLLCLMLIGVGLFSYNESQTIDTLTAKLKESDDLVASLKTQVQGYAQSRAAAQGGYPQQTAGGYPSQAPRPSWMNVHSDLDNTPKPGRR